MPSPALSLKSATGTYVPSIWQNECPNWSLAMSLIGGSSVQPDLLTAKRTSSGDPHEAQLFWLTSEDARPHQGQVYACVSGIAGSSGVVMMVHRLDAQP